jgi:hypothetical protein
MFDSKNISKTYNRIQDAKEEMIKAKEEARNDLVLEFTEKYYNEIIDKVKNEIYSPTDFNRMLKDIVTRTHNIDIA